ncbi:restriction endonuclease subunit S [Veillonella seminalis]
MKCKLEEIVDVTMGQSPKSEYYNTEKNGYPFLQGNRTFGFKYPTFDTYTTVMTKSAKAGDVIMSVRAPVGALNITPVDMCLGRGVCSLRMKNGNQSFLFYMMKYYISHLLKKESGTVFGSVNRNDISGLEVDIPEDVEEQNKIARYLEMIDDKIELNNAINNNLDQQAQTLFKSWFVDFEPFNGTMPSDWEIVPLEKIADFQNGYAFKSKELLNEPSPDCYQVFKQGHIARSGGFVPDGTKSWYPKSLASKLEKFVLKKGDILMAMTDMKDNVAILGNTAVMPLDNEYIVNQRVGHLRTNGYKGVTYPFIYLLTNSTDFLVDLRSRANSGVQVNLSSSEIKASQTVLPSEEVNNAFSEITLPMFEIIINNQLENQRLAQLRDTLLPKLMSGELDVSDIDL